MFVGCAIYTFSNSFCTRVHKMQNLFSFSYDRNYLHVMSSQRFRKCSPTCGSNCNMRDIAFNSVQTYFVDEYYCEVYYAAIQRTRVKLLLSHKKIWTYGVQSSRVIHRHSFDNIEYEIPRDEGSQICSDRSVLGERTFDINKLRFDVVLVLSARCHMIHP